MDGRVVAIAAVLSMGFLAGCAGEDGTDDEQMQQVDAGEAAPLPEWSLGQYWTYALSANGTEFAKASFVVTDDGGSDYLIETNGQNVAYFDAQFDISFVGEVRKSDLAGSQDGERVSMFQWPLAADMEWTTTWDGTTLNMESSAMGPNQFHVMGHDEQGRMAVDYHYNGDVQWFEYMVFYDIETGNEAIRLDLDDSGDAFTGTIYRYNEIAEPRVFVGTPDSQGIQDVTIDGKYNEVAMTFHATCGSDPAGQIAIGVNSPEERDPLPMAPFANEPQFGHLHDCQSGEESSDFIVVQNSGGDWELGLLVGTPNGVAHFIIEERDLEAVPFSDGAPA